MCFWGGGSVNCIRNLKNIVVCRELPVHLEAYPKLTSFSGGYALWKNGLVGSDYINLFEYDVTLSPNFYDRLKKEIDDGFAILGYIPFFAGHPLFIHDAAHIGPLLVLIHEFHRLDATKIIDGLDAQTPCSRTSNHTIRRDIFEQYMSWMEPMVDGLKATPMAGHHIERSISLFYLLNNIPSVRICEGIIHHTQANSHRTYPGDAAKPSKSELVYRSIQEMGAWVRRCFPRYQPPAS